MKKHKDRKFITPSNDLSSYNPVKVASAEGNIYGAGASGKYKKTWVTKLGFLILAVPFLGFAVFLLQLAFDSLSDALNIKATEASLGVGVGGMVMGLFCLWLGLRFIANVFKKK